MRRRSAALEAFASCRRLRPRAIVAAWDAGALMHEMGLSAEIYRIARAAADDHGGGSLLSVQVIVGELAAVEPDLLEFAWQAIVEGTADEKARLLVEWRSAQQLCDACGEVPERAAGSWLRLCPRCDRTLAVSGGDELEVRTVSFSGEPAVIGASR